MLTLLPLRCVEKAGQKTRNKPAVPRVRVDIIFVEGRQLLYSRAHSIGILVPLPDHAVDER